MTNPFSTMQALTRYFMLETEQEIRALFRARPELLDPELDIKPVVEMLIESQTRFADEEELSRMNQRAALLYECRELGPDNVFGDASSAADAPPAFWTLMEMLPAELRYDIVALATEHGADGFLEALQSRPDLKEAIETAAGTSLFPDTKAPRRPEPDADVASPAVLDRLNPDQRRTFEQLAREADSKEAFMASVERHPDLLHALGMPMDMADRVSELKMLLDSAEKATHDWNLDRGSSAAGMLAAWEALIEHAHFDQLEPENRLRVLCSAAAAFCGHFEASGHIGFVERALELWGEALSLCGEESVYKVAVLSDMASGFRSRYKMSSDIQDLESAENQLRAAILLSTGNPEHLPTLYTNLGNTLLDLHATGERAGCLTEVIELQRQAIASVPETDTERRARYSTNLGAGLTAVFDSTGDRAALEEAISLAREAVRLCPSRNPAILMLRNNLGGLLRRRYFLAGHGRDLEESVEVLTGIAEFDYANDTDKPMFLSNLGQVSEMLYARSGNPADLNRAIDAYRAGSSSEYGNSTDRISCLAGLSRSLIARHQTSKSERDVDDAVALCRECLKLTPEKSRQFPSRLASLGEVLFERYIDTGDVKSLDAAIEAMDDAAKTEIGMGRSALQSQLGFFIAKRYEDLGDEDDLQKAISQMRDASEDRAMSAPGRADLMYNLGFALMRKFELSGQRRELEEAGQAFDAAIAEMEQTLASESVGDRLHQQGSRASVYAAFVSTQYRLGEFEKALVTAESCKSRLLTNQLGRRNIPVPPGVPLDIAKSEKKLVDELADLDQAILAGHGAIADDTTRGTENAIRSRRDLQQSLTELWESIEKIGPECARFVSFRRGDTPAADALLRLPGQLDTGTALLSLFCTADETCLFLLLDSNSAPIVKTVPLGEKEWLDALQRFNREIVEFEPGGQTEATWMRRLTTIFDEIRPCLDGAKRIVISTDSNAHLLPWGLIAREANCELPVSTVPALGVLQTLLTREPSASGKALIVGNPTGDLRFAEQEARAVAKSYGVEALIGADASRETVLARLGEANVAHFATHAYAASGSPMESGIELADGPLTARDILKARVSVPNFIALSGCYTAAVGALAGEELAGLTQSFFLAGARTLLAGLWEVDDASTAHLMTGFYQYARSGEQSASESLYRAMKDTRDAEEGWNHPYYWGGFSIIGDYR